MRRIVRHWRRLLLGVFLAGLGYVLYHRLPPVERWSVRLDENPATVIFSFSADGRFVFSYHRQNIPNDQGVGNPYEWIGPFIKRDSSTGTILAEASRKERVYRSHSLDEFVFHNPPFDPRSRKRFWAGLSKTENGTLDVFDLESWGERRVPIKPFAEKRRDLELVISPAEDMVAVFYYKGPESETDVALHALPGGEQLTVLSTTGQAMFSPDGSYLVFSSTDQNQPCLRVWDCRNRRLAGVLSGHANLYANRFISPDSRVLMAWGDNEEPFAEGFGRTKIWDLSKPAKPREVAIIPTGADGLFFTPDSQTLVQFPAKANQDLVFWESTTGRIKARTPALSSSVHHTAFSPDSRLLAFNDRLDSYDYLLAVVDLSSFEVLWSKRLPMTHEEFSIVPGKVDTLVIKTYPFPNYSGELRDARSGELLASFSMPLKEVRGPLVCGEHVLFHGYSRSPNQAQGWSWDILRGWVFTSSDSSSDLVRVIDVPARREVFHLADSHVEDAQLSPDGSTLITLHPKDPAGPHLRCWDIPGRHPWIKIVGIPAAVGLVFLLLGKWRQIHKARKAALYQGKAPG